MGLSRAEREWRGDVGMGMEGVRCGLSGAMLNLLTSVCLQPFPCSRQGGELPLSMLPWHNDGHGAGQGEGRLLLAAVAVAAWQKLACAAAL